MDSSAGPRACSRGRGHDLTRFALSRRAASCASINAFFFSFVFLSLALAEVLGPSCVALSSFGGKAGSVAAFNAVLCAIRAGVS